jgi:hypothetical protein
MGAPSACGAAFDAGAWFEGLRSHVQTAEASKRQQHEALVELRHELEIQHHEGLQEMSSAMSQFARELGRTIEAVSASAEETEEWLRQDIGNLREALDAVESRPRQCSEMVQALQLGEEDLSPGSLPPSVTVEGVECLRALVKAARSDSSQRLEAMASDERATLAQMVTDARRRASRLVGVVNSHVNRLEVALQRILANKLAEEQSSRSVTFAMPPVVEAPESPTSLEQGGGESCPGSPDPTMGALATMSAAPVLSCPASCPSGSYPVTYAQPTPTYAQPTPQPTVSYSADEPKTVSVLPSYQDEQKIFRLVSVGCSQQVSPGALKCGSMAQIPALLPQWAPVTSSAAMALPTQPICMSTILSSTASTAEAADLLSASSRSAPKTTDLLNASTRSVPAAVRTGSVPPKGCEYYLPKAIRGIPVLIFEGESKWRVDNSRLKSCAAGLGYRKNKSICDSTYINAHQKGEVAAHWGEVVEGVDEGDGWVKCRFQATQYVMPGAATTTSGLLIPQALFKPRHGEVIPQPQLQGTSWSGGRNPETSPAATRQSSAERKSSRLFPLGYSPQTTSPRWRVGSPAPSIPVRQNSISLPSGAADQVGIATASSGVLPPAATTTTATAYSPMQPAATGVRQRALSPEAAAAIIGASQGGGQLSRGVTTEFPPMAPEAGSSVLAQETSSSN